MRLTLRTLMAWMDDTLPPKDVRRIGRQLERSKFSQDLSRRIRRVVRQRRLTIPGMGSNQPVDANIVSAYLDNNLPGEATGTFESLCLNSDVHLAEVAACHEILSVLDQPGSIEPEVYASMYRIVKAPESRIPSDRLLPQRARAETHRTMADGSEGVQATPSWPAPTFARNTRKFIAASVLVAGALAFASLALDRIVGPIASISPIASESRAALAEAEPAASSGDEPFELATNPDSQPSDHAEEPVKVLPEIDASDAAKPVAVAAKPDTLPSKGESFSPVPEAVKSPAAVSEAKGLPKNESPAPAENVQGQKPNSISLPEIATIAESTILFTAPKGEALAKSWSFWKESPNLPIYVRFAGADETKFNSGSLSFAIEPGSLLEMPEDGPPKWLAGRAEAISTAAGQVRFRSSSGREFNISFPVDSKFRIESRTTPVSEVQADAKRPVSTLLVRSLKGTITVVTGKTVTLVPENRSLRIDHSGPPTAIEELPAAFESNIQIPPSAALANRMMRRYLGTNRPLATSIIDAESDELPEVRQLALKIALWIDREDIVSGVLTDLEKPDLRKSAISAVKEAAARGEGSAWRAIQGCVDELALAEPDAELLDSLFTVPSGEDSLDRKKTLVNALQHDARLIRQLALDRLMQISGRDSMGFDPDEPTAKGIDAWRSWIGMDSQGTRP